MKLSTVLLCICFFISTIYAGCTIKEPFGTTIWTGGQKGNITWQEDNISPLLSQMDYFEIFLMVGNHQQVVTLATQIDANALAFMCTIPENVGPESDVYFIKICNDKNNYTAYSHTFSIVGVNGTVQDFDPNNPQQPTTTANSNNTLTSNANANNATNTTTTSPASSAPLAPSNPAPNKPSATSNSSPAKSTTTNAPSSTTKASNANSLMVYPTFVGLSLTIINFALSRVL
ncbi:21497_t:CDS:2 [Dentiscutata erythropus]|uniref:21497_t:CDS:1 n=1 Tax=Dentiscutata erythropus TaxID=1348616 RepID=A0A9N9DWY1_9GLOM|nr:21497_t:CDS:2 [Dentiscutata erythropus]